jgi:hypothetical protein
VHVSKKGKQTAKTSGKNGKKQDKWPNKRPKTAFFFLKNG